MRNLSIRIAVCSLVLATLIWSLGCGQGSPNSNVASNQNSGIAAENANVDATWFTSAACKDENILLEQKRDLVDADIAKQIRDDEKLKKQLDGDVNQQKRFKYRVVIQDKYLIAYFEGRVDGENQLEDLSEILNNFKKNKCVLRVILVPPGTLPADPNQPVAPATLSRGFEWSLCEWPKQACPTGTCELPENCTGFANSNVNTNANRTVNTNTSNSNASVRSNANF